MYRFWLFVCYCFLCRPDLFFCPGPQLNWLEFVPSPSQSDYKLLSALSPFPPYTSLHLSASISRHTRSQSPHRSEAQGPALPRAHDPASGPRVFWLLTPTRGSSADHTTAAGPLLVGLKRIQTLHTARAVFLPVQWKHNVTWSYAEK